MPALLLSMGEAGSGFRSGIASGDGAKGGVCFISDDRAWLECGEEFSIFDQENRGGPGLRSAVQPVWVKTGRGGWVDYWMDGQNEERRMKSAECKGGGWWTE